jgi:arylsulfatase A-like enzyme
MKPNILLIMTDQQRSDLRKSKGFALDTMPFLDSFAQLGTDFFCAYTSNPTCMPARVSLFTGRYPSATHVRSNHNAQDAFYTKDLLEIVKENGYITALCGKNHTHHSPLDFDFSHTNQHLGNVSIPYKNEREKTFDSFLKSLKFHVSEEPSPLGVEEQLPYRNVNSLLEFLEKKEREKPFFAWLSFAEPHNPYQVPAPYFNMFPCDSLPPVKSSYKNLPEKGPRYEWLHEQWKSVLGEDYNSKILRCRSNYCGMLRLIDDQLKRVISELKLRNLYENTIIIFLSDHGDYVGEYDLIRKGVDLPEVLVNIPMIWRVPQGIMRGKCDDVMVNIVDVLPTLCDLLKTPPPIGTQGKSLVPILTSTDYKKENYDYAYAEVGYGGKYFEDSDNLSPKRRRLFARRRILQLP